MGNYVNSTLTKDETVVAEAKLHWIRFVSLRAILTLFIAPILDGMSADYACTTKRIIWKRGIIGRGTGEMNLKKVENVQISQGILGRILGYGHLNVRGTGGTDETFVGIANPLAFRKAIQTAADAVSA